MLALSGKACRSTSVPRGQSPRGGASRRYPQLANGRYEEICSEQIGMSGARLEGDFSDTPGDRAVHIRQTETILEGSSIALVAVSSKTRSRT